jgi:nitrilase
MPVSEVVSKEEKILYCDIDLAECVEPKQFHDVVGYYNRFDIFRLEVDRSSQRPVTFLAPPYPDFAKDADKDATIADRVREIEGAYLLDA